MTLDAPPHVCPKCRKIPLTQIRWNAIQLSSRQEQQIENQQLILAIGELEKKPSSICLQCNPRWQLVHEIALRHYQLTLRKELLVSKSRFDEARQTLEEQKLLLSELATLIADLTENDKQEKE